MTEKIDSFTGEHHFLSNFYPKGFTYKGHYYKTSEHAFQAAKARTSEDRTKIRKAPDARAAKSLGRRVRLRDDWEDVKLDVMESVLRAKFKVPELREKLLLTGNAYLEEGNTWNDRFWGRVNGNGQNHLGLILMKIRAELAEREGE